MKLLPNRWPVSCGTTDEERVQSERRRTRQLDVNLTVTECETPWYMQASSYTKNVRIMAYISRFIRATKEKQRTRGRTSRIKLNELVNWTTDLSNLAAEEFDRAEKTIFWLVQQENFPGDGNLVANLRIVRDDDSIIRVATRLILGDDDEDFRYPILLPCCHPLVTQLIRYEHYKLSCRIAIFDE